MFIQGIPRIVREDDSAVFRSRINQALTKLIGKYNLDTFNINISDKRNVDYPKKSGSKDDDLSTEKRAIRYSSVSPNYEFSQIILPENIKEDILSSVEIIKVQHKVFEEWGLKKIDPYPRTCVNFYGPPGTGKTLAAHAIATYLNKKILIASYAEIESKFHGDGPKNVKAIFYAAERDDAVLFIDEADSLLSKRLINVTQGSEQAINSMRSQILICLEQFKGIIIFATNLVENYDKAFETRVKHIEFKMPDECCREKIWISHLPSELPLKDVCPEKLAKEFDEICGRDIKNAVIDAAVKSARQNKNIIEQSDLEEAIRKIKDNRISVVRQDSKQLSSIEKKNIKKKVMCFLKRRNRAVNRNIFRGKGAK